MRPGNCSGSYSEPPRARAIALRSSSRPREVDATTFSIRKLAMGASAAGPAGRRGLTVPDTIGGLYASVRLQPSADRNGPRLVGHGGRERRLMESDTPEDARGRRGA